jgi:hypothetical protein
MHHKDHTLKLGDLSARYSVGIAPAEIDVLQVRPDLAVNSEDCANAKQQHLSSTKICSRFPDASGLPTTLVVLLLIPVRPQ